MKCAIDTVEARAIVEAHWFAGVTSGMQSIKAKCQNISYKITPIRQIGMMMIGFESANRTEPALMLLK